MERIRLKWRLVLCVRYAVTDRTRVRMNDEKRVKERRKKDEG